MPNIEEKGNIKIPKDDYEMTLAESDFNIVQLEYAKQRYNYCNFISESLENLHYLSTKGSFNYFLGKVSEIDKLVVELIEIANLSEFKFIEVDRVTTNENMGTTTSWDFMLKMKIDNVEITKNCRSSSNDFLSLSLKDIRGILEGILLYEKSKHKKDDLNILKKEILEDVNTILQIKGL
ncbi:hypothetical protein HON22_00520 [Candidatus Peregrinibacteria bacterium]|jgi:hypothetical protein|nr:hypothetical protein [Candidatus Peregrinibacteria bacterium]